MYKIKLSNKKNKDIIDVLFHNTKLINDDTSYIIEYKNKKFEIEFNKLNADICYYNFFEKNNMGIDIPSPNFTKFAIIIEGEYYNQFKEAHEKYETLFSDNFFLDNNVFLFTQTIFKWNKIAGIRWFYEYKNIYENIVKKYKFGYFVLRKNNFRNKLGNLLSELDYCFINHFKNEQFNNTIKYTQLNDIIGHRDFDNLYKVYPKPNDYNFDLDYFFRVLPYSKIILLDETHSNKNNSELNWLTEKTYGIILSKIPFIPTNISTLKMIYKIIPSCTPYPFEKQIVELSANPQKIKEFIISFNNDFDFNYKILNDWIGYLHDKFMFKIYNENSLLDYFIKNEDKL